MDQGFKRYIPEPHVVYNKHALVQRRKTLKQAVESQRKQRCHVGVRYHVFREVSAALRTALNDCSDNETEEESEFVAGWNSGAPDPWLNDPAYDIGKLDISDGDNV